jgi:glycerophosphoryl diester phosphodiesterase
MPARLVRAVACRGDCRAAPENTLDAFKAALKAGADEVHAEVRVTKDGAAVLCRDASLFRTTGHEALLKDLTLSEVQQLDAGAHFPAHPQPFRVLALEEFVTRFLPKLTVLLELKEPGAVLPTVALLQRLAGQGSFERVLAVSTERPLLSSLRMLDSRVRLGQIFERRSPVTLADAKLFGATTVLAYWDDAADKGYVNDAHELGLGIYAWGAEKIEEARQAAAGGADAILYEDPAALLACLREAGLRGEPAPGGPELNGKPAANSKPNGKANNKH